MRGIQKGIMKRIDCRNMACPLPVVTVKRALADGMVPLVVLLDDGAPRENVRRFLTSRGYAVREQQADAGFELHVAAPSGEVPVCVGEAAGRIVLVGSDCLGDGPEELGRLLMKNFLATLLDVDIPPEALYFVNSGVMLTTEGSDALEALNLLENRGVGIFSCGICLDFFGRKDKLRAGAVTNMLTVAEGLLKAPSTLRL